MSQSYAPGHLKSGDLHLPQTPQRNESLRKAKYKADAVKKMAAPALNWKRTV